MTQKELFPNLTDWEPTRQTLQLYSRVVSAVPRAYAKPHPKWWHISLKVRPDGLETGHMTLPGGGSFWLKMDLRRHTTTLYTNQGPFREFNMAGGLSAPEFGRQIFGAVAELGLEADYKRDNFQDPEPRQYDPAAAEKFLDVLVNVNRIFDDHRQGLPGQVSPLNFWTHGFDLSFEWFGSRVETYEEDGVVEEIPSQINLGYYPSGDPYFYSNPWPFAADQLLDKPLPAGASWHTEGWLGTMLPYEQLTGDKNAETRLRQYAQAVFDICSPIMMA
jgi:hypothetical protein